MTTGTSHFVSRAAAIKYYRSYAAPDAAGHIVDEKLRCKEIHIGEPPLENGQTLKLIDGGTRYAIDGPVGADARK